MPVLAPTSGTIIRKASIQDLHEAVRATANNQTGNTLQRNAFGPQVLPGLVVARDYLAVTTAQTVSTTVVPFAESDANIPTWQSLTAYRMTNGGVGYTISASLLLIWWHVRLQGLASAPTTSDIQYWFCPWYAAGGIPAYHIANARFTSPELTADGNWYTATEKTVSGWAIYDMSGVASTTYTFGLSAAKNLAGAAAAPNASVPHGGIGFMALYPQ